MLIISGVYEMDCLGDEFRLIAEDEKGTTLPMVMSALPNEDKFGFDGRRILRMTSFEVELNTKTSKSLRFSLKHKGIHAAYLKVKRVSWLSDAFANGKIK